MSNSEEQVKCLKCGTPIDQSKCPNCGKDHDFYKIGHEYCDIKNYEEAYKWYEKAAEQGEAEAQYNLSVMYDQGLGVEQNDENSYKWLERAAQNGHQKVKDM